MNVNIDIILQFANLIKAAQEKRDENRRKFLENKLKDKLKKKTTQIQTEKQQQKQQQQDAQQAAQNSKKKKTKKDEEPSASRNKEDVYLLSPLEEAIGTYPTSSERPYSLYKDDPDTVRYIEKGVKWVVSKSGYLSANDQYLDRVVSNFPTNKKSIFLNGDATDPSDVSAGTDFHLNKTLKISKSKGFTMEIWAYAVPLASFPYYESNSATGATVYLYTEYPRTTSSGLNYNAYHLWGVFSTNIEFPWNGAADPTEERVEWASVALIFPEPGGAVQRNTSFNAFIPVSFVDDKWNHVAIQLSSSNATLFINGIPIISINQAGEVYYDSMCYNTYDNLYGRSPPDTSLLFKSHSDVTFRAQAISVYQDNLAGGYDPKGYIRGIRYTTKSIYPINGFTPKQY